MHQRFVINATLLLLFIRLSVAGLSVDLCWSPLGVLLGLLVALQNSIISGIIMRDVPLWLPVSQHVEFRTSVWDWLCHVGSRVVNSGSATLPLL